MKWPKLGMTWAFPYKPNMYAIHTIYPEWYCINFAKGLKKMYFLKLTLLHFPTDWDLYRARPDQNMGDFYPPTQTPIQPPPSPPPPRPYYFFLYIQFFFPDNMCIVKLRTYARVLYADEYQAKESVHHFAFICLLYKEPHLYKISSKLHPYAEELQNVQTCCKLRCRFNCRRNRHAIELPALQDEVI